MAKSILLIHNPTAGQNKKEKTQFIKNGLVEAGCHVETYATKCEGDATTYLENLDKEYDLVLVAGGDGTINEVINGVYGKNMTIGILPLGTVNVIAKELALPVKLNELIDVYISGRATDVYILNANERLFGFGGSVGFDAWVVDQVNLKIKKRFGRLAYVLQMIKQIRKFGRTTYTVEVDNVPYEAYWLVLNNGRFYAGEYIAAPKESLSRKGMTIILFQEKGYLNLLRFLFASMTENLGRTKGVSILEANKIKVSSDSSEPVQLDGDSLTELPLTVEIMEKPIKFLV